jgi:hypothetical protein
VSNLCFSIEDVKQHLYMTMMMPNFAGHCNSAKTEASSKLKFFGYRFLDQQKHVRSA